MKNINKIKKYIEIKKYYKLKETLIELLKTIEINNINYKYNNKLIEQIDKHIYILNNIINIKKKKYKLTKISLSIDDMLKLTEYN